MWGQAPYCLPPALSLPHISISLSKCSLCARPVRICGWCHGLWPCQSCSQADGSVFTFFSVLLPAHSSSFNLSFVTHEGNMETSCWQRASYATTVRRKESASCIQALTGVCNIRAHLSPPVCITLNQKGPYKIIYQTMWCFQALQISGFTKMTSTPLVFQNETFTDAYKYFIGGEYEL